MKVGSHTQIKESVIFKVTFFKILHPILQGSNSKYILLAMHMKYLHGKVTEKLKDEKQTFNEY